MPSGCDCLHPCSVLWLASLALVAKVRYRGMLYHIGVGFDVARSSVPGNAKASKRGTGNR